VEVLNLATLIACCAAASTAFSCSETSLHQRRTADGHLVQTHGVIHARSWTARGAFAEILHASSDTRVAVVQWHRQLSDLGASNISTKPGLSTPP
jgi:hypothetical protein